VLPFVVVKNSNTSNGTCNVQFSGQHYFILFLQNHTDKYETGQSGYLHDKNDFCSPLVAYLAFSLTSPVSQVDTLQVILSLPCLVRCHSTRTAGIHTEIAVSPEPLFRLQHRLYITCTGTWWILSFHQVTTVCHEDRCKLARIVAD